MKMHSALLFAVLSLGVSMSACKNKEESTMEKAVDAVGDATDTRDNEGLKDAGEDAKDVMENAGDKVEDATKK
ncbi:MAG: hypothetical protein ACT4P0_03015 [Panacagrimonas sp.]